MKLLVAICGFNFYVVLPLSLLPLHNKIMEKYKIDYQDTVNQINMETAKFANKLNIKNKLGKLIEKNACFLFKDYK